MTQKDAKRNNKNDRSSKNKRHDANKHTAESHFKKKITEGYLIVGMVVVSDWNECGSSGTKVHCIVAFHCLS